MSARLSLIIEQEERGDGIFQVRRCVVLDQEGVPVGELPITSFEQKCDANSPAVTTISTYRSQVVPV